MKDPRLQTLLLRIRAEFPGFVVAVRPYHLEEDETIEYFINLLLVPSEQLHDVAWRAWDLALEIYGDDPTPFLMTSVSPESSIEHFAEALAETAGVVSGTDFLVEVQSPILLDLEGMTITYSVETPLFSGPEEAIRWTEAGTSVFDPRPMVDCDMFVTALAVETLLLAPNPTKLPTSVRPDDPRSSFSLAA